MVRRWVKILVIFGILVSKVNTFAQGVTTDLDNDLYRDRFDEISDAYSACVKNIDLITQGEKGFFVTVPLDYNSPARGTIRIYAYFKKAFDTKKPTALYFDGGPGGNSHNQPTFSRDFNELRFDQRGVGCSQPDDPKILADYTFYSSEFIARDAEKIRETLKIARISVYGVSYGTVPATIYANLFAKNIQALVLEGTVFREKNKYYDTFYIRKTEKVYESLPEGTRFAVDNFFQGNRSIYFARMVHRFLDDNFGAAQAARYIENVFGITGHFDAQRAKKAVQTILSINDLDEQDGGFNVNAPGERGRSVDFFPNISLFRKIKLLNLYIIDCREMPNYVASLNSELSLEAGHFRHRLNSRKNFCEQYQIPADQKKFDASDYPVTAPVTYFQGYDDGRTLVAGAIQHFIRVPQLRAQFIVAEKGGHSPLLNTLMNPPTKEVRDVHERALNYALRGETIPGSLLNEMNQQIPIEWEQSLRDRISIYQASPLILKPLP